MDLIVARERFKEGPVKGDGVNVLLLPSLGRLDTED